MKKRVYPICPECGANSVVLFTPPKDPPDFSLLGKPEYIDWQKAHLYCANGKTNCKFSPLLTELTTPIEEKRIGFWSQLGNLYRRGVLPLVFLMCVTLTSCGTQFMSAKTVATYEVSADGIRTISYESTKEQQGLVLDLQEDNGKIKSVKIRADRSTTNDESVAASLALQLKMIELLQTLTAMAEKAAAMGGS